MSDITKRALEAFLKKLLLTKLVTKITINDIADKCGVNRARFCYHCRWCRSSIPTPYGMISIDWYIEDGVYDVRMELPEQIEFVSCKEANVRMQIKYLK